MVDIKAWAAMKARNNSSLDEKGSVGLAIEDLYHMLWTPTDLIQENIMPDVYSYASADQPFDDTLAWWPRILGSDWAVIKINDKIIKTQLTKKDNEHTKWNTRNVSLSPRLSTMWLY
jgi:hypothetical protein